MIVARDRALHYIQLRYIILIIKLYISVGIVEGPAARYIYCNKYICVLAVRETKMLIERSLNVAGDWLLIFVNQMIGSS